MHRSLIIQHHLNITKAARRDYLRAVLLPPGLNYTPHGTDNHAFAVILIRSMPYQFLNHINKSKKRAGAKLNLRAGAVFVCRNVYFQISRKSDIGYLYLKLVSDVCGFDYTVDYSLVIENLR